MVPQHPSSPASSPLAIFLQQPKSPPFALPPHGCLPCPTLLRHYRAVSPSDGEMQHFAWDNFLILTFFKNYFYK
jgi:hypothetical protein